MPDILVIGARGIPGVEGGAEKNSEMVFPRLVQQGYSVTLLGMRRSIRDKSYKGVTLDSLPTVDVLGTDKLFYQLFALWRAVRSRPKIVHLQGLNVCLLLFAYKLLGIKVVARYGSSDYEYRKWGLIGRLGFRLCEWQLRLADAVIAVSEGYKERLMTRQSLHNVVVVPNGTDEIEVSPEAHAFWHGLSLGDDPYVLAVGRITADKDYGTLVAAVEAIRGREVNLVVAGGPSEARYADQFFAQSNKRIRFIGRVERGLLAALYERCAVYVNCSLHEGMSNALLEAISYDRPVLASDIPANRELKLNPECYFPAGDSVTLRRKIEAAIADPSQFKAGGNFLDWDEVALKVAQVYGRVLRPSGESVLATASGEAAAQKPQDKARETSSTQHLFSTPPVLGGQGFDDASTGKERNAATLRS